MNRYHKHPRVLMRGYVVHNADNLNYDIWLDFESIGQYENSNILNDDTFSSISKSSNCKWNKKLSTDSDSPRFMNNEYYNDVMPPITSSSLMSTSPANLTSPDESTSSISPDNTISPRSPRSPRSPSTPTSPKSPRDYFIEDKIKERYSMVHTEKISYIDINIKNEEFEYNENIGIIPGKKIRYGLSYRCRLKKIDTIKSPGNILKEVESLIYYNDGWILCSVSDVDIYNRLLVELYDINKTYCINDILLEKYTQYFKHYPVNNKYSNSKNFSSFSDNRRNNRYNNRKFYIDTEDSWK